MNDPRRYHPVLHALAVCTACATFPLIFIGGLVTSHQAGMSVPDWPNSYGYNMFLFPPRLWVGGIRYEHVHRLMGTAVGFCSIALAVAAWRVEQRRGARWLAYSVLGAVIFQGVLGGLRVVLVKLGLAMVHACVAQACFCLTALAAAATSRWWLAARDAAGTDPGASRRLVRTAGVAVAVIYLQLVAGAVMRHSGAGLAILDLPLAYGRVVPVLSDAELKQANVERVTKYSSAESGVRLDRVTRGQIWIHFAHRVGALLVTATVAVLVVRTLRRQRGNRLLARPAWLLAVLVPAQIALGVVTVLRLKPADVASWHVAVGALTLVTTFTLLVRAWRLSRPAAVVTERARRGADATTPPVPAELCGATA